MRNAQYLRERGSTTLRPPSPPPPPRMCNHAELALFVLALPHPESEFVQAAAQESPTSVAGRGGDGQRPDHRPAGELVRPRGRLHLQAGRKPAAGTGPPPSPPRTRPGWTISGRALALEWQHAGGGRPPEEGRIRGGLHLSQERAEAPCSRRDPGAPADRRSPGITPPPLALSGDDLLVRSPAGDLRGGYHLRRFRGRSGRCSWTIQTGPQAEGRSFGRALAWDGTGSLVGAPAADSPGERLLGTGRRTESWGEPRRLELKRRADWWGPPWERRCNLAGDRAHVGVPRAGRGHSPCSGSRGGWSGDGAVAPSDNAPWEPVRFSLASAGEGLWVGAPGVTGQRAGLRRWSGRRRWAAHRLLRWSRTPTVGASWPKGFGYAPGGPPGTRRVVVDATRDFGEDGPLTLALRTAHGSRGGDPAKGRSTGSADTLEARGPLRGGADDPSPPAPTLELRGSSGGDDLAEERGAWVNDIGGWSDSETGHDYALCGPEDGNLLPWIVNEPVSPPLVLGISPGPGLSPLGWTGTSR